MNRYRHLVVGIALAALAWAEGGTVTGQVVNTAGGQPVAKAIVVLQGSEPTGNPPQPDSYVVESGADGRFRIVEVAPGRYEARSQREGFTTPGAAAGGTGLRITVEAGGQQQILLRLIPLGSISGRITDTDGDPVSGIVVEALRYSYGKGKKQLTAEGMGHSDDRGAYRVPRLPPGTYYLKASDRRISWTSGVRVLGPKPPQSFLTAYFPAAPDAGDAVPVKLPQGGELPGNNIVMQPARAYNIRVKIAGSQSQDSMPTVGVGTPTGVGLMTQRKYGSEFVYPNAAPGTYLLVGTDKQQGLSARQTINVSNADVEVTLTLVPERSLSGTVQVEGEVPVDKVGISLEAGESWQRFTAAVKPDGTFTAQGLPPAVHRISVTAPRGGYLKAIRQGDQTFSAPQIDLTQAPSPLTILVAGDGGTLEGTVTDEQGAPADGAIIVAEPEGRLRDWPDLVRSTTAAKDGKFELRDLAPGDYKVLAWSDAEEGAPLDPDFRKPFERRAAAIHVTPNSQQTLKLRALPVSEGQ